MSPSALVHSWSLEITGATVSTLRLVDRLCRAGWTVDVLVERRGGELEERLHADARLLSLAEAGEKPGAGLWTRLRGRLRARRQLRGLGRYDVLFEGGTYVPPRGLVRRVPAAARWQWIRTDLRFPGWGSARGLSFHSSPDIDLYLCVSRGVRASLVALHPELHDRSVVVPDFLDAPTIRALAVDPSGSSLPPPRDLLRVVSVCRLDERSKGLSRMVRTHLRLRDEGLDFHWEVVGDGPDREATRALIEDLQLSDRFHLVGRRSNPYPWLARADLVVSASYTEGLCGAVNEAKVLGRPVLSTRVAGTEEQLAHGESGWVVENDEDALVEGLRQVLGDPVLRERLANSELPEELLDDEAKEARLRELLGGAGGEGRPGG